MKFPPSGRQQLSAADRPAFTLLEVLLAAALTGLLLLAVYKAVDLYLATRTAGREQVNRDQLARSIFRVMQADLRSVLFILPTQSDSEDDAEDDLADDAASDDDSESVSSSATSVEEEVLPELTFLGDSQSLIIHASRPLRDMAYVETGQETGPSDRTSDRVEIQYFLSDSAGISGNQLVVQATPTTVAPGASLVGVSANGPQGLVRIEGDPALLASGDVSVREQLARIIAPEVNLLQFVYYDGAEPVDTWDSSVMGGLPSAVEIVIGFRPQREFSTREVLSGYGAQPAQTFRLVVPMPLTQPYVAAEEL